MYIVYMTVMILQTTYNSHSLRNISDQVIIPPPFQTQIETFQNQKFQFQCPGPLGRNA